MGDPPAPPPRWLGPVIGLVTAGVTLGVAHLVAGWVEAADGRQGRGKGVGPADDEASRGCGDQTRRGHRRTVPALPGDAWSDYPCALCATATDTWRRNFPPSPRGRRGRPLHGCTARGWAGGPSGTARRCGSPVSTPAASTRTRFRPSHALRPGRPAQLGGCPTLFIPADDPVGVTRSLRRPRRRAQGHPEPRSAAAQ